MTVGINPYYAGNPMLTQQASPQELAAIYAAAAAQPQVQTDYCTFSGTPTAPVQPKEEGTSWFTKFCLGAATIGAGIFALKKTGKWEGVQKAFTEGYRSFKGGVQETFMSKEAAQARVKQNEDIVAKLKKINDANKNSKDRVVKALKKFNKNAEQTIQYANDKGITTLKDAKAAVDRTAENFNNAAKALREAQAGTDAAKVAEENFNKAKAAHQEARNILRAFNADEKAKSLQAGIRKRNTIVADSRAAIEQANANLVKAMELETAVTIRDISTKEVTALTDDEIKLLFQNRDKNYAQVAMKKIDQLLTPLENGERSKEAQSFIKRLEKLSIGTDS